MRMGTMNVFKAWKEGRACKRQASLWTNGVDIYSYSTMIVKRDGERAVNFNDHRYSVTTTIHQNGLRALLDSHKYSIALFDNG